MKNITLLIDDELYQQIDEQVKGTNSQFDFMITDLIKRGLEGAIKNETK